MAEQADAHDSNSCSFGSVGSIPTFGIIPLPGINYFPLGKTENVRQMVSRFLIQKTFEQEIEH